MVASLTDEKRMAIGEQLAGMRAIQNLLIANEQYFIQECNDQDIRDLLRKMLEDDQKNLGILETVITQYGIQAQPKETIEEMVQKNQELMKGSKLSMYEKLTKHELLKHGQVMAGLLVHKAAQVVGADVEAAITPLNTINFENRGHQEQLKGMMEVFGVRELTGQDPDQGVWGRVQDAMAALSGVFGSAVTRTSDKSDMNVQDVIRMDHQKVNVLFMEIERSSDPQKCQEFFGQLYQDLSVHAEAEEQVVYPAVRGFYNQTQELYDEQAEMKTMLSELKSLDINSSQFKSRLQQLKDAVMHHVNEEENMMFAAIRNNCSSDQQEQLATQFKEAKKELQTQMMQQMQSAR
ncbi:MAG: hemerythrin domain-containing protein [Cyanosarcina radialis HA8281-LM2]|jgi:hemerythrin superfamily protein|nr:hemerythrin domain-containing protein [Cyanosarcina radialis HA8281-LM2]